MDINWSAIFQRCAEVTTVQVQGRETIGQGFLQALAPPKHANTTVRGKRRKRKRGDDATRGAETQVPNDDNNHVPAPVPVHVPIFPKLTSLILKALDFSEAVPGSGVVYDLILSAVQRRKATKTPLTTLCIDKCVISTDEAGKFKTLVRNFYWDNEDPRGSLGASMFAAAFEDLGAHYDVEVNNTDTDSFASD